MQITPARSVASIAAVIVLFGLFTISMSMRYGQLALPITYDDNGYLLDALRRVDLFAGSNLMAAFRDYHLDPPHSPYSSLVCALGILLFGPHVWAPAVVNLAVIACALIALRSMMPSVNGVSLPIIAIALLSWPVMSFLVIEYRPDIVCSGLTAFGALAIVQNGWLTATRRHRLGTAALFGIAVLAKPSISPLTIATFTLCIALATAVDLIDERPVNWRSPVFKANAGAILVVVLFAAGYSELGWRSILQYILFTTAGSNTDAYFLKGGFAHQALYYVNGVGGRALMGEWRLPLILVLLAGGFSAWRRREASKYRVAATAVVCLFLYAAVSATGFKSIYLGSVVPWLFLIFFVQSINAISKVTGPRVFVTFAVCLAIYGAVAYRPHWQMKGGAVVNVSEAIWRTKLIDDVAGEIAADGGTGTVFFTGTAQYFNATTLDVTLRQVGVRSITSTDEPYPASMDQYRARWSTATYVVAFAPASPDLLDWLPSTKLVPDAWRELQATADFKPLRTFESHSGGSIVLYRRIQ